MFKFKQCYRIYLTASYFTPISLTVCSMMAYQQRVADSYTILRWLGQYAILWTEWIGSYLRIIFLNFTYKRNSSHYLDIAISQNYQMNMEVRAFQYNSTVKSSLGHTYLFARFSDFPHLFFLKKIAKWPLANIFHFQSMVQISQNFKNYKLFEVWYSCIL